MKRMSFSPRVLGCFVLEGIYHHKPSQRRKGIWFVRLNFMQVCWYYIAMFWTGSEEDHTGCVYELLSKYWYPFMLGQFKDPVGNEKWNGWIYQRKVYKLTKSIIC